MKRAGLISSAQETKPYLALEIRACLAEPWLSPGPACVMIIACAQSFLVSWGPAVLISHAEELDKLITDRPESCRRPSKQAEPEASTLSHVAVAQSRISLSQLQPPPIMTLSLQSIPLHHQIQTQARIAPGSPAPAQTPPLHALPDMTRSPLPHHPMSRAPADFLNVTTDMNAEVDALDPSIMDFALQGKGGAGWKATPRALSGLHWDLAGSWAQTIPGLGSCQRSQSSLWCCIWGHFLFHAFFSILSQCCNDQRGLRLREDWVSWC